MPSHAAVGREEGFPEQKPVYMQKPRSQSVSMPMVLSRLCQPLSGYNQRNQACWEST
jgi:hypothetical protein